MKILHYILSFLLLAAVTSCNLDEYPVDTASNQAIFGSANGLELYSNSFYDILPGTDVGVFQGDDASDLVARNGVDSYLAVNALSPVTSSGWSWSALRNINYFIENAENSPVTEKNHYIGTARFFRALFYFDKVTRFGDVPWIDQTIEISDSLTLYGPRDDRFMVMDKVLEDLDFAIEHITLTSDASSTRITKNVARAYKTRIALYEASFRKYHTEYGMQGTASAWYEEVVNTANEIQGFSLHQAGQNNRSYREMFITKSPYADETILAVALDASLQVFSSANRRFISPTYGNRPSLTRNFVNTYLKIDGTPFTSDPAYKTTPFVEEVKNRDLRLGQTIRLGDYHRTENGVPVVAPPNFNQTFTGYQPIKWCYDERFPYDDESRNDNAHIIMRYAEVLLNKAEALAELGKMTPGDWSETIGALRARAGITGSTLSNLPTEADPYLLEYYRGQFTDPVLLEVIRERGVELVFEGLRPDDLRRWHLGELFADSPMTGMYVPALGEYDLNSDGVMDVLFYQGDRPDSSNPAIAYVDVSPSSETGRIQLSNGTSGEVIWNPGEREWMDKKYLYPIPEADLIRNPALGQNPGW
ncbi:RagB/SusD family nutrient uptake outer membrane protein [Algoriphagus halophytocola]|uniref:RagB/SusD family nutrient uptake outer membrane protein n=1 Tax=Algoriphagus halophytocola TaxID=2991499 RepID=A0ABY6MJD3_9BACT|nr:MULTISPECIES: RagB/SusD family nutrient uptake outer membrane protein [unclassified Algoriphagus]UZD23900.1 RagB/SusD family nutrient uptake outer membrane protein [Algoriphagus sp. TR-M5]WBL41262.1 RagB/SusD family nutrient uptake outer membrane protein [Algoriphagus sp. TR-M9]